MSYAEMLEGYDDAPESQGFMPEPLPKGKYPFKVEKIVQKKLSKNKVPQVSVLLRVTEKPYEGRTALVTQYLGASRIEETMEDGQRVSKVRDDVTFQEKLRTAQGRVKGFLKAIGLTAKAPNSGDPASAEYLFQFYRVDEWVGKEFIGGVTVQRDNNNLSANYPLDDPKQGIEMWRQKELPKQLRLMQQSQQVSGAAGVEL